MLIYLSWRFHHMCRTFIFPKVRDVVLTGHWINAASFANGVTLQHHLARSTEQESKRDKRPRPRLNSMWLQLGWNGVNDLTLQHYSARKKYFQESKSDKRASPKLISCHHNWDKMAPTTWLGKESKRDEWPKLIPFDQLQQASNGVKWRDLTTQTSKEEVLLLLRRKAIPIKGGS